MDKDMTAPKTGLEEARSRWRDGECPYNHEHGPWCDDAEIFVAALPVLDAVVKALKEVDIEAGRMGCECCHDGAHVTYVCRRCRIIKITYADAMLAEKGKQP